MRIWINENILLPASDLLRGRSLRKHTQFLEKSQHWSFEKMQAHQLKELNALLQSAHSKVDYYGKALKSELLPLQKLEDFEQIPLLTKKIIHDNYPDKIAINPLPTKGWRYHKTGGSTTGEPLVTIEDDAASDMGRASFYRAWNWMGWKQGAPALKIWGRPMGKLNMKGKLVKFFSEMYMNMPIFNAFQMDDQLFEDITKNIEERKVEFIYGYASAINEYCSYVKRKGIKINSVKGVMCTAEVLYPEMKENIGQTLNTAVYDGYACGEVNGVAYQRNADQGFMELSMERVIVEIVDEAGKRKPYGESGLIAITDLQKKVMPLIRYIPGDEGVIELKEVAPGVQREVLTKVLGRSCDIIDGINGKGVHSYFFARFFSAFEWKPYTLQKFQVMQNSADQLDVYLKVDQIPDQQKIDELSAELRSFVGEMKLVYHWNEEMNISSSGKLRWTINNLRVSKL